MPKFGYLLVAENVIQDATTRKLTLIDTFENVNILANADASYNTFFVVGRLLNIEAGETSIKVQIVGPGGFIAESLAKGNLMAGSLDVYLKFELLKFTTPGSYKLKVYINDKEVPNSVDFGFNVRKLS